MELLTAINERHSTRSFEEKKIPEELLLKLADVQRRKRLLPVISRPGDSCL